MHLVFLLSLAGCTLEIEAHLASVPVRDSRAYRDARDAGVNPISIAENLGPPVTEAQAVALLDAYEAIMPPSLHAKVKPRDAGSGGDR